MKKLLLVLLLLCPNFIYSQARTGNYDFTSATTSPVIDLSGSNITIHNLRWRFRGAPGPTCTVNLQGSNDQTTWVTVSATLTCTTSGTSQFYTSYYNYFRINVATLSTVAANPLTVTYSGYVPTPSDAAITDNGTDPLQILGQTSLFPNFNTNITTNASGLFTVKTEPGIVVSLTVGIKATQASSTIACFDSASTASLTLQVIKLDTTNFLGQVVLGRRLLNGLVCQFTGSPDITVSYR